MIRCIDDIPAAWNYINTRYTIDESIGCVLDGEWSSCWLWFNKQSSGYGQVHWYNCLWLAHRFVYTAYNGAIDDGLIVRHMCHNKQCVNPTHLKCGTPGDNGRDNIGRMPQGEANHAAKLTIEQVKEIRDFAANGTDFMSLMRRYGVGRNCIQRVCLGRRWKHIPFPPGQLDQIKANIAIRSKRIDEDKIRRVIELVAMGKTSNEIAKQEGLASYSQISQLVGRAKQHDMGIDPKILEQAVNLIIERNNRRITPAKEKLVNDVMTLASETDLTYKEIGEQLDMSLSNVALIVRGETWPGINRNPEQQLAAAKRVSTRLRAIGGSLASRRVLAKSK